MPRNYKPIPSSTSELLQLSTRNPSGLEWTLNPKNRTPGAPVTRFDARSGMYRVSVEGIVFLAHRIVYYLRTGLDPKDADVIYGPDNPEKDNRKSLVLSRKYQNQSKNLKEDS